MSVDLELLNPAAPCAACGEPTIRGVNSDFCSLDCEESHPPDDQEPDQEEPDQEERIAGGTYACGCPAGGPGGNRPHRFLGYCRRCALETGGPGWIHACGAPHRTPGGWGCRCSTPDMTSSNPGWRKPAPPGQGSLFP